MYIEVIHDAQGNIIQCYQMDVLPASNGTPFFTSANGIPANCEQARINIDTLTSMEIEEESGFKAVINSNTGLAEIKRIDRTEYIIQTFKVDVIGPAKVPVKPLKNIPVGMKVKGLVRK